jgi:hypothetical protein
MYNAMLHCLPRHRLTREANTTTLLSRHLYDFDFHATLSTRALGTALYGDVVSLGWP